ncbi:TetR/AcrR family transcriptional regulator [Microbacterium sp. BK668]|uniref:TetR/AcrR family transcriptional regulator n=1 Tax=Microbacterium sp. BK668 TaxID=2512118 RepID=UPI0010D468F6|nr:TetR/AcrR family transcriptional regulator [Microbacterium sp. BK668]TDN90661.1 TetR family transcriptional regulator [Microbacterium sp. BK668]
MPIREEGSPRANRGPAAGPENRRALIAAAREVYAEAGLTAPFSQVAKRAGVGQGSLYRHFPDRTALAVAVFEDNMTELEGFAAAPARTIEDLLDLVADQAIVSSAFIELISAQPEDRRVVHLGARYRDVVASLVDRQRDIAGEASGLEVADVLLATEMLAFAISRSAPGDRADAAARARRLLRSAFRPVGSSI